MNKIFNVGMFSFLTLALFVGGSRSAYADYGFTSVQDGAWSTAATWNNGTPTDGSSVLVSHAVTSSYMGWKGDITIGDTVTLTFTKSSNGYAIDYNSGNLTLAEVGSNFAINGGSVFLGVASGSTFNGVVTKGGLNWNLGTSGALNSVWLGWRSSNGNLTLGGTSENTITGTYFMVGINSGTGKLTLQDQSVNIFNSGVYISCGGAGSFKGDNGKGYLNITGGTNTFSKAFYIGEVATATGEVFIDGGVNDFQSSFNFSACKTGTLIVQNGQTTIVGALDMSNTTGTKTFNRIGGQGSLSAGSISLASPNTMNFKVDSSGLAVTTVTGAATLNGNINASLSGGVAYTTQNSFTAINANSISGTPTITNDLWNAAIDGGALTISLNNSFKIAEATLSENGYWSYDLTTPAAKGWVQFSPDNWTGAYNLKLELDGLPQDTTNFLAFIETGLEGNEALSAVLSDNTLTINGLRFDALTPQYFSWDFATAFPGIAVTGLASGENAVPEPASYLLLLLGGIGLYLFTSKRKARLDI